MRKTLYIVIVLIGFLHIIGYLSGVKVIRSIGAITAASPLPIVFTEVKGIETFASDFYLTWTNEDNSKEEILMTPALYSKIKGPYNRRNVFGAAIAYGPVLPKEIYEPILNYGLCKNVLEEELDLKIDKESFSVLLKTRTKGRNNQWTLNTKCQ